MKDIKFRVWVPEENRFRYCDYIPTLGFVWRVDGTPLEVGENYPQQFTGIKDKNGEEIYEGDIVKGYTTIDIEDGETPIKNEDFEFTGIVKFDKGEYCCENADFPLYVYNILEVIGNVFENPELL